MTKAAAQASLFFQKVAHDGCVWTLRDRGGYPAPVSPDGKRVQPFWSSRFRALRMSRTVEGFNGFEPVMISWPDFRDRWLPGFERAGLLIGVNWSGPKAMGYDIEPSQVRQRVERAVELIARVERNREAAARLDAEAARRPAGVPANDRMVKRTAEAGGR